MSLFLSTIHPLVLTMSEKYDAFENKEKPDIGSIVVGELLGPDAIPHSRLDKLYQKFTSWLLKRGLEGHGCVWGYIFLGDLLRSS